MLYFCAQIFFTAWTNFYHVVKFLFYCLLKGQFHPNVSIFILFLFYGTACVHFCRYMYHIQYLTTSKIFVIFFKLKLKNNMCMNELILFRDTVNISLEWVRYCNRNQLTVVSYNLMILDIKVDFYNVYFSW